MLGDAAMRGALLGSGLLLSLLPALEAAAANDTDISVAALPAPVKDDSAARSAAAGAEALLVCARAALHADLAAMAACAADDEAEGERCSAMLTKQGSFRNT